MVTAEYRSREGGSASAQGKTCECNTYKHTRLLETCETLWFKIFSCKINLFNFILFHLFTCAGACVCDVCFQPACGSAVSVWSDLTTPVSVCHGGRFLPSTAIASSSSQSKVKPVSGAQWTRASCNRPHWVCVCVCVQTSRPRRRSWTSPAAATASLICSRRLCTASACTPFSAQQRALLCPFFIQQV